MDVHEIIAANKLVEDLRNELREEQINSYSSGEGGKLSGFQIWLVGGTVQDQMTLFCRVTVNGEVMKFDYTFNGYHKEDIIKEAGAFIRNTVADEIARKLIGMDNMSEFLKMLGELK